MNSKHHATLESPDNAFLPLTPEERRAQRIRIYVFIAVFLGLLVDGMDLMFLSFSLTNLKAEFNLTNVQVGSLGSITLVGMAVGGIIGGWAADRFGRVRTLIWTIVIFSIGTAMLGLTQSYLQFAFVRGVSALGLGAEYVVANTLMAEYVSTKYRTTVLGSVQAGWSLGYLLATLLAGWIIPNYGWRWLFWIAILPVALAFWIRLSVPEPPAWVAFAAKRAEEKTKDIAEKKPAEKVWKVIWNNPVTRFTFLAWCATTTCLQFGYYGVNNWLPAYIEKEMHINFKAMAGYMVGTYTAMILGKVVAGYLADKFGRRVIFAASGIATAVFLPIIVYYHTPHNILYLLTLFGFLYGVPYGVNATYMTESFEVKIRSTAVGAAYNFGRVGAAVAPLSIGFVASVHSIGMGFVIMGGAYFLAGIIPALFIREKMHDPQAVE